MKLREQAYAAFTQQLLDRQLLPGQFVSQREEAVNPAVLRLLNRLSDHLFVLGRVLNDDGRADVQWVPGANR